MSAETGLVGHCLCGAVRFHAPDAKREVHVCHCGMCRRWTGGPEFAVDAGTTVAWEGAAEIRTYRSSEWGERAFCGVCGTALFFRVVATGETYLNAGIAADDRVFRITSHIYVDETPGFYEFADDTPRLTGADVEALVAAKPQGEGS